MLCSCRKKKRIREGILHAVFIYHFVQKKRISEGILHAVSMYVSSCVCVSSAPSFVSLVSHFILPYASSSIARKGLDFSSILTEPIDDVSATNSETKS